MASPSHPLEPDLSGRTLERYRLIRRLGIGGMGAVYEAEHTKLEKRVAVKVLRHEMTMQEIARKRFLREAKAATRVKHPSVVDISDFGETEDGLVFFVMELLAGKDLGDLLKVEPKMVWPRAQKMLLQIVSALDAAHAQGIVHRDMKPSNCFLVEGPGMEGVDFVKVLDFGIAKIMASAGEETEGLTSTDEVFGTVAYMAPEMAMGTGNDPRSDIYAVGVMMYRMLTGTLPFTEGNAFQILQQHMTMPPPRPREREPSIPEGVEGVILKAIEKKAEDRFQTMKDLAASLRASTVIVPPPGDGETLLAATAVLPSAEIGGTVAVTPAAATPDSGTVAVTPAAADTGRTAAQGTGPTYPSGVVASPTGSSGAMASPTGPMHSSGPTATMVMPERRTSPVMLALLAVMGVGVLIGAVALGMMIAKGPEATQTAGVSPAALPAVASAQPAAKVDEPAGDEAAEATDEPTGAEVEEPEPEPSQGGDTGEAAEAAEVPSGEAEPATDGDAASPEDEPAPQKKTKRARPPKTDEAVISGLKRKIAARCAKDGSTTVRLEGLIRTDGRIQGALATPKTGPGGCAEKILKSARFAPRGVMKPMKIFSVDL